MVFGPISLFTNAISGAFREIRQFIVGSLKESEQGRAIWQVMTDQFKAIQQAVGGGLTPIFTELLSIFQELFPSADTLKGTLTALGTSVAGGIRTAFETIRSLVLGVWPYVSQFIETFVAWKNMLLEIGGRVLSSLKSAFDSVFGGLISKIAEFIPSWDTIKKTIMSTLKYAEVGFENWELILDILTDEISLFASNSWERVKTFFTNIGEGLGWLKDNWFQIFESMLNFASTVFLNLGRNMAKFFEAAQRWVQGEGFNFEWTGLLDGFKSTIKQLPKFTEAEIRGMTPELQRKYAELFAAIGAEFMPDPSQPGYRGGEGAGEEPEAKGKFGRMGIEEVGKAIQAGLTPKEKDEQKDRRLGLGFLREIRDKVVKERQPQQGPAVFAEP